jgi:hypothetical protein
MVTGALLVVAATLPACDTGARLARLGYAVCGLESVPDGVRPLRCGEDAGNAGARLSVREGASLWMAVSEPGACGARPRGLVRYDLELGQAHAFRGTDAGPCGFQVHDLLLRGDTLWVATDLGVSRLRPSPDDWDEWTHYAVAPDGATLEETACGALLAAVAEEVRAPGGEELGRWLAEFRPRFFKRLRRGTRPASNAGRRRNEEGLGHAGRAGAGRGADVHPRPLVGPEAAADGGGQGGDAADVGVRHRKGVP